MIEMKKTRIALLCVLLCSAWGRLSAQVDPTLAALIATYTEKAEDLYDSQQEAMELITTGHIWTAYEEDCIYDLQREFNDYLDGFRTVVSYAAQVYGLYYEVGRTVEHVSDLMSQVGDAPANAVAVAFSGRKNNIYRQVIYGSVELVNDIRLVCMSGNKMTEQERMEVAFGIRPKLRTLNRNLVRLCRAVKYTTLNDVWLEIDERASRQAPDKADIAESAHKRWRQIGLKVRP